METRPGCSPSCAETTRCCIGEPSSLSTVRAGDVLLVKGLRLYHRPGASKGKMVSVPFSAEQKVVMQRGRRHAALSVVSLSVALVACAGMLRTGSYLGTWLADAGGTSWHKGVVSAHSVPLRLDLGKRDQFRFCIQGMFVDAGLWIVNGDTLTLVFDTSMDTVRFAAFMSEDGGTLQLRALDEECSLPCHFISRKWRNRF